MRPPHGHDEAIERLSALDCVDEAETTHGQIRIWTPAHLDSDSPRIYPVGAVDDDGTFVWNVLFEAIDGLGYRVVSAGLNETRNQFNVNIERREPD